MSGNLEGVNAMPGINRIAARLFFAGDMNGDRILDISDADRIFGNLDGDGKCIAINETWIVKLETSVKSIPCSI